MTENMISCHKKGFTLFFVLLTASIFLLCGCGIFSKKGGKDASSKKRGFFSWFAGEKEPELPDEAAMAKKAMDYFTHGRYMLAEEIFQQIKDRYPFSPYATLAELRLADCKFYQGLYEEALPLYQEFEKLHPTNEAIPYVLFQQGTCYYRLMESADRDQSATKKMIQIYERLLKRFPDSPYTYEAKKRIHKGRERLAMHEIVVAKWYYRTRHYPQAKMRLLNALEKYPDTKASNKAKKLLSKVNRALARAEGTSGESWWRRLLPIM